MAEIDDLRTERDALLANQAVLQAENRALDAANTQLRAWKDGNDADRAAAMTDLETRHVAEKATIAAHLKDALAQRDELSRGVTQAMADARAATIREFGLDKEAEKREARERLAKAEIERANAQAAVDYLDPKPPEPTESSKE